MIVLRSPTEQVHHWARGPQDLIRLANPRYDAARGLRFDWLFRWSLDRVEGTTRSRALKAIYTVLHHPFLSWERTGVHFSRAIVRPPQVILNVVPAAQSACGQGSAGCYSWDFGTPVATVGVEYIDDPDAFALILNMELGGHAAFRMLDMYNPVHQPYTTGGVMGTWMDAERTSYFPSDQEIAAAKTWLAGQTPANLIHED